MTWAAPPARARSAFSGELTVAITRAPAQAASWWPRPVDAANEPFPAGRGRSLPHVAADSPRRMLRACTGASSPGLSRNPYVDVQRLEAAGDAERRRKPGKPR